MKLLTDSLADVYIFYVIMKSLSSKMECDNQFEAWLPNMRENDYDVC